MDETALSELQTQVQLINNRLDNFGGEMIAHGQDLELLKEAFGLLLAGAIGNPLDKSKVDDVLKRLGYVPLSPLLVPGN